jgi:hypothetical protein
MHGEAVVNIITLVVCMAVFAVLALAFIIPPRRPDRMGAALCALFTTWAIIFAIALMQLFDWLPLLLPAWEQWATRAALILFGIGTIVQMVRGGAFRHGKERTET